MICSQCKKRTAVVFINKIENGVSSMEGLCKECAKKRGLDVPETNTNQSTSNQTNNNIDMNNMSKQLESLFKDLSSNLKLENLENMDFENFESDGDEDVDDENAPEGISMGIPIGSIFANFVPKKQKDEEETNGGRQKVKVESKKAKKKKKYLDTFGTNLTQKAKNNELDMVIGRDKEIQRVIQILNRRTKNNPCLIGEPGVGKTAIAQGLAIKIANNNVPAKLLNKEVYLLDMTSVIAGTQFRGQFEARMKGIIDECKEFKNIILVIDEIHNIIGAGDGEHSMNAANILKPSLANGEIQLIGTTTLREYRKYIEKDTALERRFQQVLVEEPNIDDTISILTGIKKYYEEYHKVKISNDVIKQAVIMSEKYIHDRFLPDKAIDILDEAGAAKKMQEDVRPEELDKLESEYARYNEQKRELVSSQEYEKAAYIRDHINLLRSRIDDLNRKWKSSDAAKKRRVCAEDVCKIISEISGIDVSKLDEGKSGRLLNMEKILHEEVVGQDEAVASICSAVRRSKAGISSHKRPVGSFIFLGPTGVGKTQLAKSLAKFLFGTEEALIRVDMSDYMEKQNASRLVGAPPGYIGYEEGGLLTEQVRQHPYSVVLLDEIEKAHHDIYNLLLQLLEEGELKDNLGHTVSFKNTVIIMTSNAGAREITAESKMGFSTAKEGIVPYSEIKSSAMEELKKIMSPELLNRIDDVIVFDALSKKQIASILEIQIKELEDRLNEKSISLVLKTKAKEYLVEHGYEPSMGARPMRRLLQKEIEDPLANLLLQNENEEGETVSVDCIDGTISLKLSKKKKKAAAAKKKQELSAQEANQLS